MRYVRHDRKFRRRSRLRAVVLGFVGGAMMRLFGRGRRSTSDDMRRMEFPHSTQRMGLRFDERLRDALRWRWLRKK